MSSDSEVPRFTLDPEREEVGRTWADLAYAARWYILAIVAVIAVAVWAHLSGFSFDGVRSFVDRWGVAIEYFVICFVLFFLIGRWVVRLLLRVPTVDFLVLDFETFRGAIYRIPVPLLSRMEVTGGNNLTFSWRTGDSFRLARKVDLDNGVIETAWPHEVPIEQAAFTLSDLQRREDDYEEAKLENLYLRRRPVVVATDLAKRASSDLTHEISEALRLDELDIDAYLDGLDPLRSRRSGTDDEGGESDAEDGEQAPE